MHLNARMQSAVRTTVELSDRTYTRVRAMAAERGMRGFSAIVEEALESFLDRGGQEDLTAAMVAAEGAWSERDAADWERERKEAWDTWPADRFSTPTS